MTDTANRQAGLRREWPWLLALGMLAFLAFLPGANYPFLLEWDDCAFATASNLAPSWANVIRWLGPAPLSGFTPVTMWSLMLDRWLFGLNPVAFHLHNQLLHCLAALLLYGLARHLRVSPWAAFLLALLWAVHPQRVESVVWIAERRDVLTGVFGFGSMLLFMRSFDRDKMPWAAAALLLLALDAKPSTLLLPAIMATYALWRRPRLDSLCRHLAPLLAVAVAHYLYFFIQSRGALHSVPETFPRLVLVPLHNAFWYLLTAFVPFELNPLYPRIDYEPRTWLVLGCGGATVPAALAALWVLGFRKREFLTRVAPLAAAWACLFLPVSALVRFGNTDYCDRYNYLLSAVAWLALGLLLDRWAQDAFRRKLACGAGLGAATVYLFLTWAYLPFWQSDKTLFVRAVDGMEHPSRRAVLGLGVVGLNLNDPELLGCAGRLLLRAAKENPELPMHEEFNRPMTEWFTGKFFVGMGLLCSGKPAEALRVLQEPESAYRQGMLPMFYRFDFAPRLWGGLANCYMAAGKPQDALRCLRYQLPMLTPDSVDAHFSRGMAAFLEKNFAAARSEWLKAAAINPDDPTVRRNLANLEANYISGENTKDIKETTK